MSRCARRARSLAESFRALDSSSRVGFAKREGDRKSTRLNSSHITISYAVFCLKKKKKKTTPKETEKKKTEQHTHRNLTAHSDNQTTPHNDTTLTTRDGELTYHDTADTLRVERR